MQADLFSVSQLVPSSVLSLSFPAVSEMKCSFTLGSHPEVLLQGSKNWFYLTNSASPFSRLVLDTCRCNQSNLGVQSECRKTLVVKPNIVVYRCNTNVLTFSNVKSFPNWRARKSRQVSLMSGNCLNVPLPLKCRILWFKQSRFKDEPQGLQVGQ